MAAVQKQKWCENIQSVQQERVLDFSKTIRDFKTFFFKIKVLSKDYSATT